jgi:hypothetical protein
VDVVTVAYDLAGRLSLSLDERDTDLAAFVAAQMDPFRAGSADGRAHDVELVPGLQRRRPLRDIQKAARDATVTASDGEEFFVLAAGRACAVAGVLDDRPVRFAYEPGFPLRRVFATLVRPAMHYGLHRHEAVAVHSAAVELGGRAVLVAGWSESGKTETALALMEAGARFVSDKWTVLGADGEASAFPINVGIRRWVLPHLEQLAASLPLAARAQLGAAGGAAALSRPLRQRAGRLGALAERAVALADRAALTPSELRAAYRQDDDPARRLPLRTTAILTTVPGPEVVCEDADPAWAAARLARSAAYERRELFGMLERRSYAFPDAGGSRLEQAVDAEATLLERALANGRTVEVRAPFPVDPRRVADALGSWL